MSREIKFQLVRVADNKTVCAYQEGVMMRPDTGELYRGNMNVTDHYVRRQFTGLQDKNGVDIYEGDIVKANKSGDIRRIVHPQGVAGFFVEGEVMKHTLNEIRAAGIEVIGNIYANPELLKGGE